MLISAPHNKTFVWDRAKCCAFSPAPQLNCWASRQDNVQPALPCLRPHLSVHDVAGQFVFDAHLSSDGWDSLILLEVALENFMGLIERHAFFAHPPNNSYMDSPTNQV